MVNYSWETCNIFLILDEPNQFILDRKLQDVLKEALWPLDGTLILVSRQGFSYRDYLKKYSNSRINGVIGSILSHRRLF